MWRAPVWWRRTLPVAVSLKRFAAPRWVFFFLAATLFPVSSSAAFLPRRPRRHRRHRRRCRDLLGGVLLARAHDQVHPVAVHLGTTLDVAVLADVGGEAAEEIEAELRLRHLAAAELDGRLDLVALFQEPHRVLQLRRVVVVVDVRTELDFLDLDRLLLLPRIVRLLLLL